MKPKEYFQCGHCGESYEKEWSDEESLAEAEEIFGKPVSEWKQPAVVICDDCFQKMNPRNHPELVEESKKVN